MFAPLCGKMWAYFNSKHCFYKLTEGNTAENSG